MAKMLGKSTLESRQGGNWWYCCPGHDGTAKIYVKINRTAQRIRENRQWRKDEGL